jgi:hypothetical protein
MVAYSFKSMFAPKILDGTKRQTIRADRKRHVRPGEELQLYTGMRTRQCRLIARVTCEELARVRLMFEDMLVFINGDVAFEPRDVDVFARRDGFEDWPSMRWFWQTEHGAINEFEGVLITWKPLA